MILPDQFISLINSKLGETEAGLLVRSLAAESPVSIRLNPFKKYTGKANDIVPWCPHGRYLGQRPVFTLDPAFHAGAYYVQEASSMVLWHVLSHICSDGDVRILDLCAAPGGKATLTAAWLGGRGLLVANEFIRSRASVLRYNIMKEGHANVVVTHGTASDFARLGPFFDVIITDAPCSGEGMFRKDDDAISHWSIQNVESCAVRQKSIISDVMPALKEGGFLIYSTCTYNDEENINNTDHFARTFDLHPIKIDTDDSWHVSEVTGKHTIGYQFYPHQVKGEGFFISVLQKSASTYKPASGKSHRVQAKTPLASKPFQTIKRWIQPEGLIAYEANDGNVHITTEDLFDALGHFEKAKLYMLYAGVTAGKLTREVFVPDHSLALSNILSDETESLHLSYEDALLFLKKNLTSSNTPYKGWMAAAYEGNVLGFLKNLGDRLNNYLPNEYRIMMELPPSVTEI